MKLWCPIFVILDEEEIGRAIREAHFRVSQSVGRKQNHGYDGDRLALDIPGAFGELVFCKATGREWRASVNTFKGPDAGRDIQVRCAPCKAKFPPDGFGNLIVRHDDDPEHRFVLVVGNPPYFVVRGWIYGREAMQPQFLRADINNREPAWLVPCAELRRNLGERK
jgi:hypothetical protein